MAGDFLAKMGEVLAREQAEPEQWFYLSIANDAGYVGSVITRGRGVATACLIARSYGLEFDFDDVLAIPVGRDPGCDPKYWHRLLTRAQVDEAFAASGGGVAVEVELP